MKKALILVAALVTASSSSVAMAASPVELDGTIAVQYRSNTYDDKNDKDGGKFTFTLNALSKLNSHFDVYARIGAQYLTDKGFGSDFSDNTEKHEADIDQFGFIYKNSGVNYKIGRQAVTLGETALLYNTAAYIGDNMFDDGITITTKTGATDLKVVAVQEDRVGDQDNKLYAVQASYKPSENWKVGGVLAKYDYENSTKKDTNHWAVNAGYKLGKAGVVGEFTQSDADTQNTAHAYGVTYNFDGTNSAYVYAHETAINADLGGWTDFDNGEKGTYYGVDHKISKDKTFSLFYKNNKNITTDKGNTSFRATLTYKF